jgi:hypothetical protein
MVENGIKAVPMQHEELETWRHTFTGVSVLHEPTNLHVFGGVDDVWLGDDGKLIVVDYKATSKDKEVTIDSDWQVSYKRQLEIYQWLFKSNGFSVSDTGYFVYANGRMDADGFHNRLEFITKLIPYTGTSDWVDQTLLHMKACMDGEIPRVGINIMGGECQYCAYARSRTLLTIEAMKKNSK